MGLEKEKADARIFMDEDEFNRSSAPMLTEKSYDSQPDRDPHDLNGHLKLSFEDVIAEPDSTHSFDKVWICSTALFEISKYLIYKLLTVLLAIPLAFILGLLFAILSCLHIWVVMPFVRTSLMLLPSVQAIWRGLTDSFVAPLFASMGRCFSTVSVRVDQPF
ncbi:caveolin-2 [Dendrobates tinctorius]|uniref:caveolin-2 n=1 Tax=Dendrobates tinctorius TaxID=92724 RepID=UPI003CC99E6F